MKNSHLYIIAYLQQHIDSLEEGYGYLDNLVNDRSDWREYWPMRQFLLSEQLDENAFYGFFSPRFAEKTGLSAQKVHSIIETQPDVDVITFSPQVDIGAFFQNVFIGGELADAGFLETSQKCVDQAGLNVDLTQLVMDSRSTVFSNFFVAKPFFWRKWLDVCEVIFNFAENKPDTSLSNQLRYKTNYKEGVERKVFVVEGIVSLLLSTSPSVKIYNYNPFKLGWSAQLSKFRKEAIICDALKTAIKENKHEEYAQIYHQMANKIISDTFRKLIEGTSAMKQTPAHDLYNDTILELLPPNCKTVVEVGCMRGSLAKAYQARYPDCSWTGIDIDEDNAELASKVCQKVLCRDIEHIEEAELASIAKADAWVFGDTLEHLRNPWAVISRILPYLPENGVIIASIPNAQHWSFQARVNVGLFRYEDDGLFDRTHIRFFTRTTIFEMFEQCGYQIEQAVSRVINSPDAQKYMPHIRGMAQASGFNPDVAEQDSMAFQYVIRAKAK